MRTFASKPGVPTCSYFSTACALNVNFSRTMHTVCNLYCVGCNWSTMLDAAVSCVSEPLIYSSLECGLPAKKMGKVIPNAGN